MPAEIGIYSIQGHMGHMATMIQTTSTFFLDIKPKPFLDGIDVLLKPNS
jgi:hypothetical protein